MTKAQVRETTRPIAATTIPAGEQLELPAGTQLVITQTLGGTLTVCTRTGALLRIAGVDADAVGVDAPSGPAYDDSTEFSAALVTAALRTVFDPEIPVSIVDLGLVYRCEEVITDDGRRCIEIDMSMTAPGCGMGEVLRDDVRYVVSAVPGVDEAVVEIVWDPPWSMERMTDEARLELGLL